jgi:DNA sulfur modification protein DndD
MEATHGQEVTARVTIEFEHEDRNYTLERITTRKKGSRDESVLVRDAEACLFYIDEDGQQKSISNPNDAINQILPERLHSFFFFDGERIERLVKPDAYAEIEDGIKTVLGLEIIERSIRHTSSAIKKLEGELKAVGSPEIQKILDDLSGLETQQSNKKAELKKQELNKDATKENIQKVDGKLRTLEQAKRFQDKRDSLEAQHSANQQRILTIRGELGRLCSQKGYLAFTEAPARSAIAALAQRRAKGEIPTPIKRQFVEDLLQRGECICGCKLVPGDPHYNEVAGWRDKAGSADVEEAWTRLSAHAEEFVRSRVVFYNELHQKRDEVARLRAEQTRLSEEISEVSKQLVRAESEEVRQLELRRDELKGELDSTNQLVWSLNRDLQDLAERIKEKEKERDAAKAESEKAKCAQRRVHIATQARDVFQKILAIRTSDVRAQLDERLKGIYSKISYKPYIPSLTTDFRLELAKVLNMQDELVAKSSGENQILSLAFVGGIADLARQRYQESKGRPASVFSFQGGIYPIVMDSPFGTLDENYRSEVAQAIPILAPQVIIFLSKAQGLGAVQGKLAPRIGEQYVVSYYTPKKDASEEEIVLDGRKFPYIKRSSDFEWAVVTEA